MISTAGFTRLALTALATLSLLAAPSAHAAVKQIAGTRVTLDLPDGYEQVSDYVLGFAHRQLGVRFLVARELDARSLDFRIRELESPAGLQRLARGEWRDPQPSTLGRTDRYAYVRLKQTVEGRDEAIFLLVFGAPALTAELLAIVPQDKLADGTVPLADIERVLASARIVEEKLDLPAPARFGYLGRFHQVPVQWPLQQNPPTKSLYVPGDASERRTDASISTRLVVLLLPAEGELKARTFSRLGNGFMAARAEQTEKPRQVDAPVPRGYSASQPPSKQIERIFASFAIHSGVQVTERRTVEIAGMAGVELVGSGVNIIGKGWASELRLYGFGRGLKEEVGLYQVVLEGKDGLYVIAGQARTIMFSRYLTEFRKMAESLILSGQ